MRITLSIVILILLIVELCYAQSRQAPGFEDYLTRISFPSRRVPVNIRSTPFTPCFRTMLRLAARSGDKFAGHYGVVSFGCGTECIRIGITDLVSGRTYVSPFAVASAGIEVRPGSRLLVADSPKTLRETYGEEPPPYKETRYFVWDGHHLAELKGNRLAGEPGPEFKTRSEVR